MSALGVRVMLVVGRAPTQGSLGAPVWPQLGMHVHDGTHPQNACILAHSNTMASYRTDEHIRCVVSRSHKIAYQELLH